MPPSPRQHGGRHRGLGLTQAPGVGGKAGGSRGSEPRSGAKEMKILSEPVTGYVTVTSLNLNVLSMK